MFVVILGKFRNTFDLMLEYLWDTFGRGGDLFVKFLLISRKGFLPGWFYMPYAIRKVKNLSLVFFMFYPGQKMNVIVRGCLIDQMKRFDALITTPKTPSLCKVPFLKKSRKTEKNVNFWKIVILSDFSWFKKNGTRQRAGGILRCNQCIKTLHLGYQTHPYNNLHFLAQNGFLQFFLDS